jgi:hypothetical protein
MGEAVKPNLKSLARMPEMPRGPQPGEPDPALIWFFDSSKQLLVYRDTESGKAAAWSESALTKNAWKADGLRSLPRVSVNSEREPR